MTKPNPTDAQFAAFQALYDYFNRVLFLGVLKPVLLNFSRKANTLGFFAPLRWENSGETVHEISLNPAYLRHREPREVASTLVHEMAHAWQMQCGKPGRGGYHNEEWAAKMESLGLMPSSTAAPGGKRTGDRMSHYIIDGGPFARAFVEMPEEYLLPWLCWEGKEGGKKPRAASKVKFTCPACGANAWGRPGLLLACGACGVGMTAGTATDGDEHRCAA
jgi:SprT-like family